MNIIKCNCCPECGESKTVCNNDLGDGYRVCKNCHQEWWTDIFYKYHIAKQFRPYTGKLITVLMPAFYENNLMPLKPAII